MTVEVSVLLAVGGFAISLAAFFIGRTTASRKEGLAAGSQSTAFEKDIEFIKGSLERIEDLQRSDSAKTEGRIEEMRTQLSSVATVAEKARSSAKSAHLRMNTHERMDHGKPVTDWREEADE